MGVPQLPKRVRYNGPYSMSLDRPGEFGLALLTNVAYWEVPRLAVGLLMRWRYGGKRAKDTKDKEFVACAPSYIMSLVHAVIVSGLGLRIMARLWDCPVHDKFYINQSTSEAVFGNIDHIERANWLFFGYMVDDLANVLAQYPRLGKGDMVAHHAVFIAGSILAGGTQTFLFPFSWLIAGELSTPLLTARWFVRQLAAKKSPTLVTVAKALGLTTAHPGAPSVSSASAADAAAASLELVVSKTFVTLFFVVRVLVYGSGLAHTLRHLSLGTLAEIPPVPRALIVGILLAGAGLNAHWMRLMLIKVLGLKRGKGRKVT